MIDVLVFANHAVDLYRQEYLHCTSRGRCLRQKKEKMNRGERWPRLCCSKVVKAFPDAD